MKLAPAQAAASSDLLNVPVSSAGSAPNAAQFSAVIGGLLQSAPRTSALPSTGSPAQPGPREKPASPDQATVALGRDQDTRKLGDPIVSNVKAPAQSVANATASASSLGQVSAPLVAPASPMVGLGAPPMDRAPLAAGAQTPPSSTSASQASAAPSAAGKANKAAPASIAKPGARIGTGEPVAAVTPNPALASASTPAAAPPLTGASLASGPDLLDGADADASAAHDPSAGARQGATTASAQAPTEDAASLHATTQPSSSPLQAAEGPALPPQAASQSDRMPPPNSAAATPAATALASSIAGNPGQPLDAPFPIAAATRTTTGQPANPSDLPQAIRVGPVVQHADGSQTIALQLHPASLGRVTITVEHAVTDTAPRVVLAAEKPETLALLTRDNASLQQILDQAGVPREGRSVLFQPALPETAQPHAAVHTELTASAPPTPNASADPNASHQRDQRSPARRPRQPMPASAIRAAGDPAAAANVDITA